MIKYDFVNTNYPDFIYRLEEFYKLFDVGQDKISKLDAVILYAFIRAKKPQRILEIGRCHGTSTAIICGAINDSNFGQLYSVDVIDSLLPEVRRITSNNLDEYVLDSKDIVTHPTLAQLKYQLFFIDGDHSLTYQLKDIETCVKLSDTESWIFLHDSELPETAMAVAQSCNKFPQLIDLGKFGDQCWLIKYSSLTS